MRTHRTKHAVIFGGTGFIGSHLARLLVDDYGCQKVMLADVNPPEVGKTNSRFDELLETGVVAYRECDVRERADLAGFRYR